MKHIRQQIRRMFVEGTWSACLAFDKRDVYVTDQLNEGLIEEQEVHVRRRGQLVCIPSENLSFVHSFFASLLQKIN